jgi:hypothetical protein
MNACGRKGAVLALAILAVAFVLASPVQAADETLTIDTTTVRNVIVGPALGVNYVAFWDPIQGSVASREAMRNAGIEIVRFPGGAPGDWYDWADPYAGGWSSTSTMDLWNYAQGIGPDCVLLLQTNPTTNELGNGQPNNPSGEHVADWVTYCANNDIAVPYWDIGNEQDIELVDDYEWETYQWYLDIAGEQMAAMHAADPSIKVMGNVGTNTWYWWGLHSLDMFLQVHGNIYGTGLVDNVCVHCYDCPSRSRWPDVIANAQNWQGRMDFINSTIEANDTRDLDVFITETSGALGPGSPGNMASLMARALGDADWIGALRDSGVEGITLFGCIHNVSRNWGLLYGDGERGPSGGADSPTPGYYVLPIWTKVGKTIVQVNGLVDPATTMSAYAGTKPDSAQVVLINKTGSARSVQAGFTGFSPDGKTVAIYELRPSSGSTSNTSAYYNGVLMPDPAATSLPDPALDTCVGTTYTTSVPAYSIVMLDFGVAVPNAPSNLGATAVSSQQIDLAWTDNSSDEDGFKVERKTGAGGTYAQVGQVGANETSFQDTGLEATTTYYYRVRAYSTAGHSAYSNEANATTPGVTIPDAPSGLSATTVSQSQIDLAWTDNSNDEDGFSIERKTGAGGTYEEIDTVDAGTTMYEDTGLVPSTTYYYRVCAYNAAGSSAYSNEANATTDDASAWMHVSNIYLYWPPGSKSWYQAVAEVTIVDEGGSPVVGATVSGEFTGDLNEPGTGYTNESGVASIGSSWHKGKPNVTFCVQVVTHPGFGYDPAANVETCDSTP